MLKHFSASRRSVRDSMDQLPLWEQIHEKSMRVTIMSVEMRLSDTKRR
jgi:hypothetical protein